MQKSREGGEQEEKTTPGRNAWTFPGNEKFFLARQQKLTGT